MVLVGLLTGRVGWACAQVADSLPSVEPVRERQMLHHKQAVKPQPADTIYQGTTIRVDLLNLMIDLARSGWQTYSLEAAVNVRLKNRFFPTIEGGYAGQFIQEKEAATPIYDGSGGFVRLGLDINPLKKHPEQRSCLLVGVRAGTALQHVQSPSLQPYSPQGEWIGDAWGEIVAGVQVDIAKGFNMGWAIRMKFLFTRQSYSSVLTPYYIPGFGYRNNMNWGFHYYLGYTF